MNTIMTILLALLAISCGKNSSSSSPQKFQETVIRETYMEMVNDHRQSLGLLPLIDSPIIEETAYGHSFNMSEGAMFGHYGMKKRCRKLQNELRSSKCGEIVARGQKDAKEVFKAWLNSADHRKSIEDPSFTHSGLGFKEDKSGKIYWTQMFVSIN